MDTPDSKSTQDPFANNASFDDLFAPDGGADEAAPVHAPVETEDPEPAENSEESAPEASEEAAFTDAPEETDTPTPEPEAEAADTPEPEAPAGAAAEEAPIEPTTAPTDDVPVAPEPQVPEPPATADLDLDKVREVMAGLEQLVSQASQVGESLAKQVQTIEGGGPPALPRADAEAEAAAAADQAPTQPIEPAPEAGEAEAEREAEEQRAREEAEAARQAEAEREAEEQRAREAAEAAARAEAEREAEAARQAEEQRAREEAEAAARAEAEREAEAARQAEEQRAREEAEAAARAEAEREAEATRQAEEQRAREAAEAAARAEAEREAEAAREAEEQRAREAAEAAARAEAEREAEAARQAEEQRAREEAEAAARAEAEREAEATRQAEEQRAREEAEAAALAQPSPNDTFEPLEPAAPQPPTTPDPFQPIDAQPQANISLPPDSPLAEPVEAAADPIAEPAQRKSPEVGPLEGVNDYVPAYADEDDDVNRSGYAEMVPGGSPAAVTPPAADPTAGQASDHDPMDVLFAIAQVDQEAEAAQHQENVTRDAYSEASANESKSKRSKVKMEPLPFDALVPGTPIIATYYSPSGGVGKSSQAMNTAVYIASIAKAMAERRIKNGEVDVRTPRVLLLDGDVVQGSLALRLKGEVTPNIHELFLYLDKRKAAGFEGKDRWPAYYEDAPVGEKAMRDFVMWPEKLPNLNLLAAPDEPELFFDFGPAEYKEVLQLLSQHYDVIIIDAGTEVVMESNRAWLGHANEVLMITAPEIDRIYNASKAARFICSARPHPQDDSPEPRKLPPLVTADRLSVIMTRADSDSGINPADLVDKSFPWMKDRANQKFFIPDFSKEMVKANNTQRFLALENPEYARVIGQLAKHIFARYTHERQRQLPRQ